MYRKQSRSGISTMLKVLLIVLVCGGTLAAFIGIMIFVAEWTGWYIFCIGLCVAILQSEARAIWSIGSWKKPRAKYRR